MGDVYFSDVKRWLATLSTVFATRRQELNALDAAIGDGDHGTTMARGFEAARVATLSVETDIGSMLQEAGRALLKAGGAAGPLFGTIFVEAGRVATDRSTLASRDVADMLAAAAGAVERLGGARPGQKTLIDALQPAAGAARAAVLSGGSTTRVVAAAADAARAGVEQTRALAAHHGRARFLGERAIGQADPGAVSVWLMLDTLLSVLNDGGAG